MMQKLILNLAALCLFFQGMYAQPYTAPVLLHPSKGATVDARDQIRFQWSMVAPAQGFSQNSLLEIVEVLPGQSPVQALRSNVPLITRPVEGLTLIYLSQRDFPMFLGDSMHFAWTISPIAPSSISMQHNGARSEPIDFWMVDGLRSFLPPQYRLRISDCGLVDAGPDRTITASSKEPVTLGAIDDELYHYEWVSDPPGYHAYQSQVKVFPSVTTRYVVFRTDTATDCVVSDEVWVKVEKPFALKLIMDDCGNIHAVPISSDNGEPELLPYSTIPCEDESSIPPTQSRRPKSYPQYAWSNGSREQRIAYKPEYGNTISVTVTCRNHHASASIMPPARNYERFRGEFPTLIVPEEITLGTGQFHIDHENYPADAAVGMAAYNATSYRLTIIGPDRYLRILEGYTTTGFTNGDIAWDEEKVNGKGPGPGSYYWWLSLRNCDYPLHDPVHLYRVRKASRATERGAPASAAGSSEWMCSGKFEVE